MKLNDNGQNQEPNKKVLIDPSIPIEELLGSVTTYNTIDGSDVKSLQVRSSARVLKKVKDLAAQPLTSEKKAESTEKKEETKPEVKKPLRTDWTLEEKNLFFEALNEYGKDFEAIQLHVNNKLKKKCLPEYAMKTRQQVRHLYFKFWHKISKHLIFSDELKKIVQELYGLINFGELRKKISVTDKTCRKLNELIYRGFTLLRIKGKTIRVRTPNCRALRRLNQLDENGDDIKLPTRVLVELKPKNMETWMKVQELSQNPRVKTLMPLQKRLSSLLTYMGERWKSPEVSEYEKLISTSKHLFEDNLETKPVCDPTLRFCPLPDATITIPVISITEYFNTHSICLTSYEERNGVKSPGKEWLEANPKFRNLFKVTPKKGVKRMRAESSSEKCSNIQKPQCSSTDNNENCVLDSDCSENKFDEILEEAVNKIIALTSQEKSEQSEDAEREVEDVTNEGVKKDDDCLINIKKEHEISKIRCGWSISESGTLAIGDLYLMFGANAKLTLEYSWDKPKDSDLKPDEEIVNNIISNGMEVDENDGANKINSFINNYNDLSVTLKRLLSVAKLHYRKNIVKCSCGHVCGEDQTIRNKNNPANIKNDCQQPTENKNNITTTGSMVPVRIQQQPFKKICPADYFRRPVSPNEGFKAQIDSLHRLTPRYCNRKGRPRTKHMVVERKLPLLPNKEDSGRKIVQMNITSQDTSSPRHIAPKLVPQNDMNTNISNCVLTGHINNSDIYNKSTLTSVNISNKETIATFTLIPVNESMTTVVQTSTPKRADSPTSISHFLDMALKSHEEQKANSDLKEKMEMPSFTGLIHNHALSPPTSPSTILKENDNQWYTSEVADYSLSSLLGHLESPAKTSQMLVTNNEDSRLSLPQDVEAQLQCLMTETSLDYTAKFADLAAEVTNTKK